MIKEVQKKNSKNSLTQTNHHTLSIQFSLDGFSFCISNSNTVSYFSTYTFEETVNSLETLLEKIKHIFSTDANLHHHFENVLVIHQNNLNTLVPNDFFDDNKLASYLNFNIKILPTDYITFDPIDEISAKNIYIPYVNINNYLFQNFGEFEFKHHSSILIEKLIQKNDNNEKVVFVNVSKNTLDIIVLEQKNLILYNSFSFITEEDFIYYILFIFEQLQLNKEVIQLYFIGEISAESALYKITFKYIKNINFLSSKASIFENLEMPTHSNFILLG